MSLRSRTCCMYAVLAPVDKSKKQKTCVCGAHLVLDRHDGAAHLAKVERPRTKRSHRRGCPQTAYCSQTRRELLSKKAVPHETCFTRISADTISVVRMNKDTCGHLTRKSATGYQTDEGFDCSLADAQWKATYHWLVRGEFDWRAGSTPKGLNMS
jgi:hypothetical protein